MTENEAEVALRLCDDYREELVRDAVNSVVADLGGMERFVKKGQKVLIKPNMLVARDASRMVTTHPAVMRRVMSLVADAGASMTVGDSPAIGSAVSVARKAGLMEVAEHFGADVINFREVCCPPVPETCTYKMLELAGEAIGADVIINLPKVKTHGAMTLTAGVKNMFGCIVGRAKTQWHLKAGRDALAFARMLVDVYATTRPVLTVADGVWGMEGNGPNNGTARKFGWVAASRDAVALDAVIAEILRIPRERVYVLEAARRAGVGEPDMRNIRVLGASVAEARKASGTERQGIELPGEPFERSYLGGVIRRVVKRSFVPEPVINHEVCTRCGNCVNICPPQVMSMADMRKKDRQGNTQKVEIDRQGCIHCFCCQEICPEGAITVKTGRLAGLLTRTPA